MESELVVGCLLMKTYQRRRTDSSRLNSESLPYKSLVSRLRQRIEENRDLLIDRLKGHVRDKKRFSLCEIDRNTIFLIKEGKSASNLHIGFPFPVYSTKTDGLPTLKALSVDYFLRGEPVREVQREQLFSLSTEVQRVSQEELRDIVRADFSRKKSLAYVDPYNFIGDGIIGLFYPESFMHAFNVRDLLVFSNSSKHINGIYPSQPRNIAQILEETEKRGLLVMPDLIDNQWESSLTVVKALKDSPSDVSIAMPGRNVYVKKLGGKLITYWREGEDILLRNKNIEDYMAETLHPFLEGCHQEVEERQNDTDSFFVNPFGSRLEKAIPEPLVLKIYLNLAERFPDLEFNIVGGYYDDNLHQRWVSNFLRLVRTTSNINGKIGVAYYSELPKFTRDLERNKCSVVITADTSIGHLANKLGYPNVCIYSSKVWDLDSVQSMTSDSPLGFARYFPNQFPVLLRGYDDANYDRLAKEITQAVSFMKQPRQDKADYLKAEGLTTQPITSLADYEEAALNLPDSLRWVANVYNPATLFEGIQDQGDLEHLVRAAIQISPLKKIQSWL